ncbi:TonB-dependent receptor plug domain-containing protein [Chitinophaga filiformis]|uniref:TonB-dependent receptor n=1 Tax=Chitinophaga filiformis TaxID=104663 RepID=A0ABY4I1U0_CHIFI|nr:TonB-dependent receptor [Chitinophaga filiformis]UPK69583.1 TonB-dependent receptor [Chitinophaga filiformis]
MRSHLTVLGLSIALCNGAWAQSAAPATVISDSVRLRDVVVTGQYTPQSLKQSVYQVRTISGEYIKLRGATNVLGVLDNELGVRFSNDATLGETDVELMGMSGTNVKILLDGVPLADRGSTRQSLTQIDINTIERIEIVEGPMSVAYGTDALAGVINIITKKYRGGKQLSVTARVQEETVGKEYAAFSGKGVHNENLGLQWGHNGFFAGGGITRNDFGGWSDTLTGRKKAWKPKDQLMANGSFGYTNDHLKIWYRLDYLDEDIISRGDINFDNGKATDQHYLTDRYTHQAQAMWQVNKDLSVNGAASYQQYKRVTRTTIKDFTNNTEMLSANAGAQDVSKFNTIFFRGTAQYTLSPVWSFQPGIEYRRDGSSGERISGTPEISDYSLFLSAEIKPIRWLNVRPGVRLSRNSVYDAPPLIPSVNTKLALRSNLDLRLSYARGFRAPALRELYFYFFDASHSIKGNRDLKAEYSNSFTGSLSWQAIQKGPVRLNATATGFYNDFHDRIDLATINSTDTSTYVNISRFKTTGATLSGVLNWKELQVNAGIAYIGRYNQFADDDTYNKSYPSPEFTWTPEVNANITYHFRKTETALNLSYKFNGERPAYEEVTTANAPAFIHEVRTEAFHQADFTVSKGITKYVTINAGVRNLFDNTNISNSTLTSGQAHTAGGVLPMWYGRSYFAGLSFNWNSRK